MNKRLCIWLAEFFEKRGVFVVRCSGVERGLIVSRVLSSSAFHLFWSFRASLQRTGAGYQAVAVG